jgi:hypothetical protein
MPHIWKGNKMYVEIRKINKWENGSAEKMEVAIET